MNVKRLVAALIAAVMFPLSGAKAADVALGIDPMVLEFSAPYGGEAHASVTVSNSGSVDELIYARPVDWRTSSTGDVVFERPGTERNHSLTGSLRIEPSNFVLHAGETRQISVRLQMPPSQAGTVALWGGYIVRATPSGAAYSSAVPGGTILVYDTVGNPRKHITLSKFAVVQSSRHGAQLSADLLNDGATYVRPLVRIIVQRGDDVVREKALPCSVIFAGDRRALSTSLDGLASGRYRVHFILDYGGDSVVDGVTNAVVR